jgi:thioesterase domain-containing protein
VSVYAADYIADEDRVIQYSNAILTTNGSLSPIVLMGYSAGGNLAFEVAQELERKGQSVSNLILIDSEWQFTAQGVSGWRRFAEKRVMQELGYGDSAIVMPNQILEGVRTYLDYLSSLVNTGTIDANIHLITSGELSHRERTRRGEPWRGATTSQYAEYQGFGGHFKMLNLPYASRNFELLKTILSSILHNR